MSRRPHPKRHGLTEKAIFEALASGPARRVDIARASELPEKSVWDILQSLVRRGLVRKVRYGWYELAASPPLESAYDQRQKMRETIFAMRQGGALLETIGLAVGRTRERVRQILAREGMVASGPPQA